MKRYWCELPLDDKILIILYYANQPVSKEKLAAMLKIIDAILCEKRG